MYSFCVRLMAYGAIHLHLFSAFGQVKNELVGRVLDEYGQSISNASVYNKTDKQLVKVEINGRFRLRVAGGDTLLLFSDSFVEQLQVVPFGIENYWFHDFILNMDREIMASEFLEKTTHKTNNKKHSEERFTVHLVGKVLGVNGVPLAGANVSISNALNGTTTTESGIYELMAHQGDTIYFSFLGHLTQLLEVPYSGENVIMHNALLVPHVFMLQGVNVTENKLKLNLSYDKTTMDA